MKNLSSKSKICLESSSIRSDYGEINAFYLNDSNSKEPSQLDNVQTKLYSDTSSEISNESTKILNLNLPGSEFTSIIINSLKESNLLDNNHLTPAKIHHLDSFIRTSSYRSTLNDSPNNLSSNFYNTLLDNQLCSLQYSNSETSRVEFNLDYDNSIENLNENVVLPINKKQKNISFDFLILILISMIFLTLLPYGVGE